MIRTAAAALFVALIENGWTASRRIFDQTRGAGILEFLHKLKDCGALCCVGNEEVNADKRLGTMDVTDPNIVTENTAVVDSMRNEMLRAIVHQRWPLISKFLIKVFFNQNSFLFFMSAAVHSTVGDDAGTNQVWRDEFWLQVIASNALGDMRAIKASDAVFTSV